MLGGLRGGRADPTGDRQRCALGGTRRDDRGVVRPGGAFGEDLSNPLANYTLGWLDPIAAHSDFTNPRALELAAWMSSGGRIKLSEPADAAAD